ncbi:glycosyltransferase family 2 protein [Larkinella harenae]
MKLSIITINLNNASGLSRTIESVLSQTSSEVEFIVIDGGSTDGSTELLRQYQDKIDYWISEPDHGIYHAMNKGIRLAKGVYCQFLNSGDYLASPDVIERMLDNIPDAGVVIGNLLLIERDGKVRRDKGTTNDISFLTFYRGTLNHSSAFIKRELFDLYGLYDETLRVVSDWKFYLIVVGIHNEKVIHRNIDVSYFKLDGISTSQIGLLQEERRKVLNDLVPKGILLDYDRYWFDIEQMNRLKKNSFIRLSIYFLERFIFKVEAFVKNYRTLFNQVDKSL